MGEMDLDDLFQQARDGPLRAGNVALVVATLLDRVVALSAADRVAVYAFLREACMATSGSLVPSAHNGLIERLLATREPDPRLAADHEACVKAFRLVQPARVRHAGTAHVLFACPGVFAGRSFGAAHPLILRARPFGQSIQFAFRERRDVVADTQNRGSIYTGFWNGVKAGVDWVIAAGKELSDAQLLRAAFLLNAYQFTGEFASIQVDHAAVDGESLGLGAAVAAVSALLELPLPDDVAFTGRVDVQGTLHRVGGMDSKLAAAANAGMRRVYLPTENAINAHSRMTTRACAAIGEVLDDLFPEDQRRLALQAILDAHADSRWHASSSGSAALGVTEHVLLSFVAASDPIGTYRDQRGRSTDVSVDGPILGACREIRPARVYLFFTVGGGSNDFSDNVAKTVDFLGREWAECVAEAVPLSTVDDPTDLDTLWVAMTNAIARRGLASLPDGSAFVNVSSGTPQMMVIWHLLVALGRLNATLLQVREPRHVREQEARVRRVSLPSFSASAGASGITGDDLSEV